LHGDKSLHFVWFVTYSTSFSHFANLWIHGMCVFVCALTYVCTHARPRARARTRAHAHTHTHTHRGRLGLFLKENIKTNILTGEREWDVEDHM